MTKSTKSVQTNGTKERIVTVASRLFSKRSYEGVSLEDIAKELKITKAALYYHFSNKEEIYLSVLDKIECKLNSALRNAIDKNETSPEKRLKQLFKNPLDELYKEEGLIKGIVMAYVMGDKKIIKRVSDTLNGNFHFFQEEIEYIASKNKRLAKMDSQLAAQMIVSLMRGLLLDYALENRKVDTEKMSDLVVRMLLKN